MLIPLLHRQQAGTVTVTDFKPSAVIRRHNSDIWGDPLILECVSNLVALVCWLEKGNFEDIRSVEESFAGGVDPAEIPDSEPTRFLAYCVSAMKDRATAAITALNYGAANVIFERVGTPSIEGLKEFFVGELKSLRDLYPEVVDQMRVAISTPGVLRGFYATSGKIASESPKDVMIQSFWQGKMSNSMIGAPDFCLSPSLTIEEGFRLMASPPVGRMRTAAFSGVSTDLTALATAIEVVFKRLSSGAD